MKKGKIVRTEVFFSPLVSRDDFAPPHIFTNSRHVFRSQFLFLPFSPYYDKGEQFLSF